MRPASFSRQIARGLRSLVRPAAADRDVTDEIDSFLDEATAAYMQRGLPRDAARRAAHLDLGTRTATREQVRTSGWENVIGTTLADLRYGIRRLRSNPGFAVVSTVTLALGIGASTAIFSAVNPILFAPLPYAKPGQLMSISDGSTDGSHVDVAFANYREIAQRSRSFSALAVFKPWQPSVSGDGEPERLDGQRVSADYFRTLAVAPRLGRDFEISDDVARGPSVAILSDGLWKRRFGADPAIVGKAVSLSGYPYIVVGVMPEGYRNTVYPNASIWAPLQYDVTLPPDGREWGHHLEMLARLHDGVTAEQARRELATIAKTKLAEFPRMPWASFKQGILVRGLQEDLTRSVRPALLAVLGAVLLLLIIACVNVVNLLIARGVQRRGEFAMRVALGAGRRRLVRQVLTETLLLAGAGGTVGMIVAALGVRALVLISPAGLRGADTIHVDGSVLAFGLLLTTAIGIVVGIIPALQAFREDPRAGLQRGTQRVAGGRDVARRVLVVGEVSLALVLLVSAGLLLRSLERLFAIAPGFEPAHVLSMQVQAAGARFTDKAVTVRYFADVLDAVRRVPGVRSAGFTSQLPLSGDLDAFGAVVETDADARDRRAMLRYAITPGYVETMRIPIVRGRTFDARDDGASPSVALVSEQFATQRFSKLDPIGKKVKVGGDESPWMTIVGIVGDVKQGSLASNATQAVYLPTPQSPFTDRAMSLVVRGTGDVSALAPSIQRAIWSVDRSQPIVRVATMDRLVASTAADRHFTFVLLETFALVALLLAATGIFGVLSGSVTERMREIGVRAALGATRGDLLGLVMRQGLTLTLIGVVIGVGGAMAASRGLVSLLFGVSRVDPITYIGVIIVLGSVSAIACWAPAWRAAGVDPVKSLRAE